MDAPPAPQPAAHDAEPVVLQCSAWEVRHEPWEVMEDLIALGVPRTLG